ncbi:BlaI/MecI/CopY family transcriptional regulator, partial [Candidatus Amesbacteria bacterium]|nr:BlaI/MecI/CopY family transcriptional regulator [Candidatus Amesbacteria bacterium]
MINNSVIKILGDLEKEVMDIVWEISSPITVREVHERVGKRRQAAYTTVMTIMTRLTDKGLLNRKSDGGKAYTYQAVYSREKFLTNVSKQIIKNFIS